MTDRSNFWNEAEDLRTYLRKRHTGPAGPTDESFRTLSIRSGRLPAVPKPEPIVDGSTGGSSDVEASRHAQAAIEKLRQYEADRGPVELAKQAEAELVEAIRSHGREPVPEETTRPKKYLFNWLEILDALGMTNDEERRGQVRRLNDSHAGPIAFPGKGAQPKVDRDRLIAWWNGLERRFEELEARQIDRRETVSESHNYGSDGTVIPEISGSIKKRRSDRRPR